MSLALFRRNHTGVTIVELLVVVGIVGLLSSLALLAVQQTRETARALMCRSRLKNASLAIVAYDSTHGRYPPGTLFGQAGVGPSSYAWSWMAACLPHCELQAVFDKGQVPSKSLVRSGILAMPLNVWHCPSDTIGERVRSDLGNLSRVPAAVTNFKAVCGANWGEDTSVDKPLGELETKWLNVGTNGSYNGLDEGDGIMFRTDARVTRRPSDVLDGLSNTMLLGEALPEFDAYTAWAYSNGAYSTCAIPPNTFGGDRWDYANMQSFRSLHSGVVGFAFADGSVRAISGECELRVYYASATIAGAERSY